MIINFSIQNYGSVKDKQTLSFEADRSTHLEDYYVIEPIKGLRLLKLALIYGANASGKTTILHALEFLRNLVRFPEKDKTETIKFTPFLFDANTPSEPTLLSMEFIQNNIRYYYEVTLNRSCIVSEEFNFYNPNKANVFKRTTDENQQFTKITFGSKIKIDKVFEKTLAANTLWNNTVLAGFLKTNIELKELKDATDWFSYYLKPIIQPKTDFGPFVTSEIGSSIKKQTLVDILRKADFNISNISIKKEERDATDDIITRISIREDIPKEQLKEVTGENKIVTFEVKFEHTVGEGKYLLPINKESLGTQRYYGFAGLLSMLINDSTMLSIDELESSLHPDLFTHFLLSFLVNAKESQIIATTHNRELLNNKDIFRNDAIWITDKSEACATELYSLADLDSSILRDTSNVYNAYKAGKLGGVPNLGDYYIDIDDERE